MARGRKTQSDDSEEETRRQVDSEGEEAASGDESEEYEIEAILDAEHGAFPGVSPISLFCVQNTAA